MPTIETLMLVIEILQSNKMELMVGWMELLVGWIELMVIRIESIEIQKNNRLKIKILIIKANFDTDPDRAYDDPNIYSYEEARIAAELENNKKT